LNEAADGGGRLREFEGRLSWREQDFFAPSGNTLLWQDFPFNRTRQLAWLKR